MTANPVAPFFSEPPPAAPQNGGAPAATREPTATEPAMPLARTPLQDGRTDFNVVFIHSRLDDYGLPPAEFRVYAHVARRASSGAAFPAIKSIGRVCRLHPKTVRRALRVLVTHRLLRRMDRPGQTAVYCLTPASEWQPKTQIGTNPCQKDTHVSKRKDTPPKPIQGHPSQRDTDEGNPSEGNPRKEGIHTHSGRCLPRSELEAVEAGKLNGIPEDFAREQFNRMEAVGWIDGTHRPVKSWSHYLKQRWSAEQSQRAERRATGRAPRPAAPPRHFANANYAQPVENF